MAATAQKAVYDASQARRRSMIGKVKLAQKALGLDEDTYRAMLDRETGNRSAADCTEAQLVKMLEALKRAGFKPVPRMPGRSAAAVDTPTARKARALWISLHQLGVVHNPSEIALESFVKKQMKVEAWAWADEGKAYKLIEALKSMAERNGWSQSVEGIAPSQIVKTLKLRLCEALLVKLKACGNVPAEWRLKEAAFRLCGIEDQRGVGPMLWSAEALDVLAKGLARELAAFGVRR